MANMNKFDERRKTQRFQASDGLFAVIDSNASTKIGQIIDISKGGIGFRYKDYSELPFDDATELVVISDDSDNMKNGIRYTFKIYPVSDIELQNKNEFSKVRKKRCSVKFHDMSFYQKSWLHHLILNYTKGVV